MKSNQYEIGVGPTEELSLRASIGVLVSVLFRHPEDRQTMLALERTATLRQVEGRPRLTVKAKPFGGAVRLIDPRALKKQIGNFHYDSERSREEEDFRLQICPASWGTIREICQKHFSGEARGILDSSPERELTEEFEDALHIRLRPEQYQLKPQGMIIEGLPVATDNVRVEKIPTVRVYFMFAARMESPEIISMILDNTNRYSDADLEKMAWKDAGQGGKGRANAILAMGLDHLKQFYLSIPAELRGASASLEGHQFDGNVPALLEELETP